MAVKYHYLMHLRTRRVYLGGNVKQLSLSNLATTDVLKEHVILLLYHEEESIKRTMTIKLSPGHRLCQDVRPSRQWNVLTQEFSPRNVSLDLELQTVFTMLIINCLEAYVKVLYSM